MRKIFTTFLLTGLSLTAFAQQWNPTGENRATGNLIIGSNGQNTSTLQVEGRLQNDLVLKVQDQNGKGIVRSIFNTNVGWGDTGLQLLTTPGWPGYYNPAAKVRMHIAGNGNIGIGTIDPLALFDVRGQVLIGGKTRLDSYKDSNLRIVTPKTDNSSGSLTFGTPDWNTEAAVKGTHLRSYRTQLEFQTSHAQNGLNTKMLISPDGNVGIGTLTPATRLDVAGVVRATKFEFADGQPVGAWSATVDNKGAGNLFLGNFTRKSGFAEIQSYDQSDLVLKIHDRAGNATVRGIYDHGNKWGAAHLQFLTSRAQPGLNPVSEVRMHIGSTGNVGIGTTSPTAKLDVVGAVNATQVKSDHMQAKTFMVATGAQVSELTFGMNGTDFNSVHTPKAVIRGTHINDGRTTMQFLTRGHTNPALPAVTMHLDHTGNVGIGTITPSVKLDVVGVVKATKFELADGKPLGSWNTTAPNQSTGNLTIGSNGQNTTTLQVEGKLQNDLILKVQDQNGKGIVRSLLNTSVGWGDTGLQFLTTPGWPGYYNPAAKVRMHIAGNGNVGIGNENPTTKLDVTGDFKAANANITGVVKAAKFELADGKPLGSWNTNAANQSTGDLKIGNGGQNTTLQIDGNSQNDLVLKIQDQNGKGIVRSVFNTSVGWGDTGLQFLTTPGWPGYTNPAAKVRLHIAGNGNVGIGNINPSAKLDVTGTIKAHEILVEVPAGADFVFENNYNLKPLSEVESFIIENKHLPEVQSEKDMQENGVNMNQFQIKLLQKVEELTLYIIQQDKRIQELESASQNK